MQLELLTGLHDPNGMGAMFFAVLAAAARIERNYIREKTLEGQATAAAKGHYGVRPEFIDEDTLTFAQALKDKRVPVPEIAKKDHDQDRQEGRPTSPCRLAVPRFADADADAEPGKHG